MTKLHMTGSGCRLLPVFASFHLTETFCLKPLSPEETICYYPEESKQKKKEYPHVSNSTRFPAAESVLYNSPLGILILEADEAGLTAVRFSPEQAPDTAVRPGPITTRAAEWLDGYFSGSCPEPDFL